MLIKLKAHQLNCITYFERYEKMNFKLNTLVVAAVMAVAATSASAAQTSTFASGSSVIFSAWDADKSYSLDIGKFLNDFVGADTAGASTPGGTTGTSTNSMVASGSSYSGAVAVDGTIFDIVLNGFNFAPGASAVWNLAAGDRVSRNRALFTEAATFSGITNTTVFNLGNRVTSYLGLGAAPTPLIGQTATSSDPFYADSASWGDTLGAAVTGGTSNTLGGVSNVYLAWGNSITASLGGQAAGLAQITAGGNGVFGTTYVDASNATHFKLFTTAVAAVPEADTSAMMLAGLGLMGFIARRRNSKQA